MKNAKFFSYLLIIISTSLFVSCTRESVDYYGSTPKETITKSQWSVDYYFAGNDRTAQFNNFRLNFNTNGIVVANDGTHTIDGSWNMLTNADRNNVLKISMPEAQLQDMNDQWTISVTSNDLLIMKGGEKEMRLKKL